MKLLGNKGKVESPESRDQSPTHIIADLRPLAVEVSDLVLKKDNARKHGTQDLTAIAASLRRYGQRTPLVVNRKGNVILKGNGTYRAAVEQLGWTRIAAVFVEDDPTAETGYSIADNRTAELSEWDDALLLMQLEQLQDDLGDDDSLLADLMMADLIAQPESPAEDAGAQIDRAEELQEQWQTARGQVWEIVGPSGMTHRLMCGDSTCEESVDSLLDGEAVDLVHADPPYGMNLDTDFTKLPQQAKGKRYAAVIGDDQPFDFRSVHGVSSCNEQIWWGADYYRTTIPDGGSWFVWDKRNEDGTQDAVIGNQFELAWSKRRRRRRILRFPWTVFDKQWSKEGAHHPTQKPVTLIAEICREFGGNDVYDPFLGSGTTMVAAEQLGRRCFGMEIEPKYVAVALQRMADLKCEVRKCEV